MRSLRTVCIARWVLFATVYTATWTQTIVTSLYLAGLEQLAMEADCPDIDMAHLLIMWVCPSVMAVLLLVRRCVRTVRGLLPVARWFEAWTMVVLLITAFITYAPRNAFLMPQCQLGAPKSGWWGSAKEDV